MQLQPQRIVTNRSPKGGVSRTGGIAVGDIEKTCCGHRNQIEPTIRTVAHIDVAVIQTNLQYPFGNEVIQQVIVLIILGRSTSGKREVRRAHTAPVRDVAHGVRFVIRTEDVHCVKELVARATVFGFESRIAGSVIRTKVCACMQEVELTTRILGRLVFHCRRYCQFDRSTVVFVRRQQFAFALQGGTRFIRPCLSIQQESGGLFDIENTEGGAGLLGESRSVIHSVHNGHTDAEGTVLCLGNLETASDINHPFVTLFDIGLDMRRSTSEDGLFTHDVLKRNHIACFFLEIIDTRVVCLIGCDIPPFPKRVSGLGYQCSTNEGR